MIKSTCHVKCIYYSLVPVVVAELVAVLQKALPVCLIEGVAVYSCRHAVPQICSLVSKYIIKPLLRLDLPANTCYM